MNLIITTDCDRNCKYCFVPKGKFHIMELEQIEYIASFHDFNRIKIINILGGEPTLHPELAKIIAILRVSNMNSLIQFFSHCGNDSVALEKVEGDNIVLVANCYEDRGNPKVHANLRLAMPAYKMDNSSVSLMNYSEYIGPVEDFNKALLANKIASYNDCPMPMCMNRYRGNVHCEQRGFMYINGIRYGDCNPPYDIYPDYRLTGCMGIGERIQLNLKDMKDMAAIENFYKKRVEELRAVRILSSECSSCQRCKGGCFGFY